MSEEQDSNQENAAHSGAPAAFELPEFEELKKDRDKCVSRLQDLANRYLNKADAQKLSVLVLERFPRESRYSHRVAIRRGDETDRRAVASHLQSTTYRVLFQYVEAMYFDILFREIYPENGFIPQIETNYQEPSPVFTEPKFRKAEETKSEANDGFGYLSREIDLTDVEKYKSLRSRKFSELQPEEQLIFVLQDFVHSGNSDLHMQINREVGRVSYRSSGDLTDKIVGISHKQYNALAFGLCVAGGKTPQDMRFEDVDTMIRVRSLVNGKPADVRLRFNSMPSDYGVAITIRSQLEPITDINKLGFNKLQLEMAAVALSQPEGMIPVTGATGSGKTNTLESFFTILQAARNKKIIEVGSPCEIYSPVRTQWSVNESFTAQDAVRAALRADPDVICVGEAREREYLMLALDGALTGHLMMLTYHASNVEATLSRFLTMGVEPDQIAVALNCIVSQKLVKTICRHCRQIDVKTSERLPYQVYHGAGCHHCFYSGVGGRSVIAEMLLIDDEVKDWIEERLSPAKLSRRAMETRKLVPMREHAHEKVLSGEISYASAIRALGRQRQSTSSAQTESASQETNKHFDIEIPVLEEETIYA